MSEEKTRKEDVEKRKKKSGWKKIGMAVVGIFAIVGGTFLGGNKKQ